MFLVIHNLLVQMVHFLGSIMGCNPPSQHFCTLLTVISVRLHCCSQDAHVHFGRAEIPCLPRRFVLCTMTIFSLAVLFGEECAKADDHSSTFSSGEADDDFAAWKSDVDVGLSAYLAYRFEESTLSGNIEGLDLEVMQNAMIADASSERRHHTDQILYTGMLESLLQVQCTHGCLT